MQEGKRIGRRKRGGGEKGDEEEGWGRIEKNMLPRKAGAVFLSANGHLKRQPAAQPLEIGEMT